MRTISAVPFILVLRQDWKAKGFEVYGVAVDVSTTGGQQALFESVRAFVRVFGDIFSAQVRRAHCGRCVEQEVLLCSTGATAVGMKIC